MGKGSRTKRTIPKRLKGFRDITAADALARDRMIAKIREVYERYGFVPLETPALEYVDVLGKYVEKLVRRENEGTKEESWYKSLGY